MNRSRFIILFTFLAAGIVYYLFSSPASPISKKNSNVPNQLIWTPQKDLDILTNPESIKADKMAAVSRLWSAGHESAPKQTTALFQTLSEEDKKTFVSALLEVSGHTGNNMGLKLLDDVLKDEGLIKSLNDPDFERRRLIYKFRVYPTLEIVEEIKNNIKKLDPNSDAYVESALTIYKSLKDRSTITSNLYKVAVEQSDKQSKVSAPLRLKVFRLLMNSPELGAKVLSKAQSILINSAANPRLRVSLYRILESMGKSEISSSQLISLANELPNGLKASLTRGIVHRCQNDRSSVLKELESIDNERIKLAVIAARNEINRADPCKK